MRSLFKTVALALATLLAAVLLVVLQWLLKRVTLRLIHLGGGTFRASESEEILFEYLRDEPFTLTGYISLKNMTEDDLTIIREYVRLTTNGGYELYAEEEYYGEQKEQVINIEKLPALTGIKVTLQQPKGIPKHYSWDFYMGVVG